MAHRAIPARLSCALGLSATLLLLSAGVTTAGEITGNGQLKDVKGHSACAYSGQEDLQWYVDDEDLVAREDPTRGDPGHAQSWGQYDKAFRDAVLIPLGLHPSQTCNPTRAGGEP